MSEVTKQGAQQAIAEAQQAVNRARTILDDLSESYAEDLADAEFDGDGDSERLRVLSDSADLVREAGERLANAADELTGAAGLIASS
jgi:hypothetical protein